MTSQTQPIPFVSPSRNKASQTETRLTNLHLRTTALVQDLHPKVAKDRRVLQHFEQQEEKVPLVSTPMVPTSWSTVRQMQDSIMSSESTKDSLQNILRSSLGAVGAQKGSIMLWDETLEILRVDSVEGLLDPGLQAAINAGQHPCRTLAAGEGIAGQVFITQTPMILQDTVQDARFVGTESHTSSLLCVPICIRSKALGVVNLTNSPRGFAPMDIERAQTSAAFIAMALEREQLRSKASRDSLTQVSARGHFLAQLSQELRRSWRYERPTTLILIDIDHFKHINDTHGHAAGDRALQAITAVISDSLRDGIDLVGRIGGDEFAIMLPETDLDGAWTVTRRLLDRIRALRIPVPGHDPIKVTLSMGGAAFPDSADLLPELMEAADRALYATKARGRDGVTMAQS